MSDLGNVDTAHGAALQAVNTLADFARRIDGQAAAERDLALAELANVKAERDELKLKLEEACSTPSFASLPVPPSSERSPATTYSDVVTRRRYDGARPLTVSEMGDIEINGEVEPCVVLTGTRAAIASWGRCGLLGVDVVPEHIIEEGGPGPVAPPNRDSSGSTPDPSGPFVITRRDGRGRRFWTSGRAHSDGSVVYWVTNPQDAVQFDLPQYAERRKPRMSKVVAVADVPALIAEDVRKAKLKAASPTPQQVAEWRDDEKFDAAREEGA